MKNISLTLFLLSLNCYSGVIPTPNYHIDFSAINPISFNLDTATPFVRQSTDCDTVYFTDYFFLGKESRNGELPSKYPITDWQCLLMDGDQESYGLGYDPSVEGEKPANQIVSYDEKSGTWKIVNRKPYHKDEKPLQLFNVTSPNAKGYMVVDENINKYDIQNGVIQKKGVKFCLIENQKKSYALCGEGNLLINTNGKEMDFTPYFLKSLESMALSNK